MEYNSDYLLLNWYLQLLFIFMHIVKMPTLYLCILLAMLLVPNKALCEQCCCCAVCWYKQRHRRLRVTKIVSWWNQGYLDDDSSWNNQVSMCFMILKSNELLIKLCSTSSEPAGNPKLNNAVFYNSQKNVVGLVYPRLWNYVLSIHARLISLRVAEQTELPWL